MIFQIFRCLQLNFPIKSDTWWTEMDKQMKLQTHGSFVQQGRDAEDVIVTDVRHGAFDDALAALQTPVALERIPRPLTVDPMEHVQLPDPGYQHQL